MIQKTYIISSIDEIAGIAAEIHGMPVFKDASCKVLLTFLLFEQSGASLISASRTPASG